MKRSFRGFLGLALAACVAISSLAVASVSHVAGTVFASCRAFKNLLVDGFLALATPTPDKPEAVPFVRAKAFVLRLIRRERVVLTSSWRHCPSI